MFSQEKVVTTLAGSGVAGFANGTGDLALFNYPTSVAVDANGNIIVADTINNRIRKVTKPGGVVTTLAGSSAGFADGTGSSALFHQPGGVAVDANGNIIVADTGNHTIRKVTPMTGVVTTLAGNGAAGVGAFADGTGTNARFEAPSGICIDNNGDIIVTDSYNNRIRKVTNPGGVVTTLAGSSAGFADGTGSSALFHNPAGVAVDANGNIIVADTVNHSIRKVTNPGGVVTTLAGNGAAGFANGTGSAARFNYPNGIVIDANGDIIVADTANNRIRKVTNPGGVVTTLAGSGTLGFVNGTVTTANFYYPFDVDIDNNGDIIIPDAGNNCIRVII